MRNRPGRQPAGFLRLALIAWMLAIVTPLVGSTDVATAATVTPWAASGPGNFTLDSNGAGTPPPQMTYNLGEDPSGARFTDQTWTLSTTAISGFTDVVPYFYTGYHAYFQVTVHLEAFVTRGGVTTTTSLVAAGPAICCTPPSGGFTYTGNHSFDVQPGDVYGFRVGGRNFDSDPHFYGTLRLATSLAAAPPYQDAAAVASNTSWTTAAPLTSAGISGTLTQPGEARWYKFPIQPDSQVEVILSNLDQNFDLTMFRDIGQMFTSLTTTQDLIKLSAQFAGDAYSPSIYSPSIYSPSIYSPSIYSPSIYSPSIYSPSIYSPSIYSPSIYSPSIYSPSDAFLAAFSSAQTRSLIAVSARENSDDETVRSATWNNTGDFYVRVQGRNGAFSPTPFHLALSTTGGPCTGVTLDSFPSTPTITGTPGAKTVILTDGSRLPSPALHTKLQQLAAATSGVVVDVSRSERINNLNTQADANKACPYAKNLVAEAIRDVVNSYRDANGTLQYVVIAGGDSVIPFFRYADSAGLGPESDYVPPALDTSASQASLRRNYVLGQDAYGAVSDLELKGAVIPVPDLAVGRLVETPDQIIGMVNAFLGLTGGVLPTPTSSLVTGYDFLTSAADSVQTDFAAGLGANGRADTLITNQGVPTTLTTSSGKPSRDRSWTAADLKAALFGSRHDLVFLAGHFSANDALAADYQTSVATTDLAAHPDRLANSLVISAGCHGGYNLLDADGVPGLTQGLDWPEEMAKQRATFISGTGYQYADTDFLAYSAKLYAMLATELRRGSGAVPVGDALVSAKRDYLAGLGNLTGIDQKSLIESTLYGLPMTAINLPSGRIPAPTNGAGITPAVVPAGTPGSVLGLKTFPLNLAPPLEPASKPVLDLAGTPIAGASFQWLTGRDGVQTEPALPALPLQIDDVTSSTGEVLRGVGFWSGTYTERAGVRPLTGAPATEQNGVHTDFVSPAFFPQQLATANHFGALGGNGTDGRTRLLTTPVQYRSDTGSTTTNTERRYSKLGLQLFYSSNIETYGNNTPAQAAPPSLSGVESTVAGNTVTVRARVTGDPSAGIQQAWATYTAESGPLHAEWQSVGLAQHAVDSTLWTGTIALPSGQSAADVRFIVQAVNGVGLVGLDNNLGYGFTPGVAVGAPLPTAGTPTAVALDASPSTGVSGTSVAVAATLSPAPAGSAVTFTLGSVSRTAHVDAGGRASATLPLQDAVGDYVLTASYGGDANYGGSSAKRQFSITKVPTALAVSPSPAAAISAVLTRTVASTPLPQQTVYFTVTGPGISRQITATTDPQGRARLQAGSVPDGTYTVSAEFLGTASTFLSTASRPTQFMLDTQPPSAPTFIGGPPASDYFGNDPAPPTCTSTDALSGVKSCVVTGGGTSVGAHSYTATATDFAGNTATSTLSYTVLAWTTKGFYAPVDMGDVLNTVKGGSTVPLKFEVFSGTTELTTTSSITSFTSGKVSCSSGSTEDAIEEFASTGGTTLRYDNTGGQFIQSWKTPTGANTCYKVTVTTRDGSTVSALFKIK